MSRSLGIRSGTHLPSQHLHLPAVSFRPGRLQRLPLTVRSTEAPASAEFCRVLSSLDSHKLEILRNVNEGSYQLLASCDANAQMQDDDMASLLLRITAFHRLWCQQHSDADYELCDINNMISKIALMTTLLAGGSSQHVLQTIEYVRIAAVQMVQTDCPHNPTLSSVFCRRHPPVIAQDASCIVERMVHIKQLIPQADVSEVVAKRPSLLCMEVRHLVLFRVAPSKPHACRYKLESQVPPVLCVAECLQSGVPCTSSSHHLHLLLVHTLVHRASFAPVQGDLPSHFVVLPCRATC